MLGVDAGGTLLVLRLVADLKRMQQLAGHLIEPSATLKRRVDERAHQLNESKTLLYFILEASPSGTVLFGICGASVCHINPRLLKRLGC